MFRALSPLRAASAVGAARRYLSVHEYLSSAFPAPALRLAGGWRRAPSAAALRRHRHRPPRPRSGAARRARCGRAAGRRGDDAGGRGGGGRQHPVGLGDGRRGGRRRHQGAGADGRPRPGHLYQRLPRRRAHGDVGGASREHCAQNARPAADYEAGALRRREERARARRAFSPRPPSPAPTFSPLPPFRFADWRGRPPRGQGALERPCRSAVSRALRCSSRPPSPLPLPPPSSHARRFSWWSACTCARRCT